MEQLLVCIRYDDSRGWTISTSYRIRPNRGTTSIFFDGTQTLLFVLLTPNTRVCKRRHTESVDTYDVIVRFKGTVGIYYGVKPRIVTTSTNYGVGTVDIQHVIIVTNIIVFTMFPRTCKPFVHITI